ncbi:hypothetical protein HED60_03250 [Planctomycetales bacterium ZRK34]|nr:hypothetical protein HED60_03250 [Planctomycetales bacterium ZRK34]
MGVYRWLCVVVIALIALGGCTPKQFNTASLSSEQDLQSQASKYWKKEGWWSLPKSSKKVAITEFSVEYVTKTGSQSYNAGLIAVAQLAGMGKKEYRYDEQMKQQLPTDLYNMYVAELQKRGFEVIPAAKMWETKVYEEIASKESGDTVKAGHSTGSMFNDRVGRAYQHGQVYGAAGTIVVDTGFFASFSNPVGKEISAAAQAGADTALHVRIKVGIDSKGRATLWPGSIVNVYADMQSWGDDNYGAKTAGAITSKEMLYFADPVIDAKNYQAFKGDVYDINGPEYAAAIKDVFPQYAALSIYAFKK